VFATELGQLVQLNQR